jgi:type 1 glutamine amidotransferase
MAVAVILIACVGSANAAQGETTGEPKRVLVVTGQDYPGHEWRKTAPVLSAALAADPRLHVTVTEDPGALAASLDAYDVVVLHFMNWEQPDPGPTARANLERFVAQGKGLCLVHFACGAFQAWPEFRNLAGRVWDPKLRGHDPHGKFRVDIAPAAHAVTEGLEPFETTDELYTCLVGDRPIEVLATARSVVDGKDYPMAFAFAYGQGRVFHSPLGHDVPALARPAVGELFRRGCAWAAGLSPAWRPRHVLLIAGDDSHGEGAHRHTDGVRLLKECLDSAGNVAHVTTETALHGWPEDPAALDKADCIVVYSDGFEGHPLFSTPERKDRIRTLLQKGVGLVCLHYAVAPPRNAEDQHLFLEWLGGYYEEGYSKNPVSETQVLPATTDHAICRGVTPYRALEEFYYRIRFDEAGFPTTPIVAGLLPPEAPNRETIAWARTRNDGGRSFGFTGGHFHASWRVDAIRKMVLNAILWTAGVPVPTDGVVSMVK